MIDAAAFWSRVDIRGDDDCWEWQRACGRDGHGHVWDGGEKRLLRAHRVAWMLTNGAIPPDCIVRHSCDNPPCCNPNHLLTGTHADNVRDRCSRGRSAHQQGEANGRARLTTADVVQIRQMATSMSKSQVAREFGITQPNVNAIVRGRSWKHIKTGLENSCDFEDGVIS